MRHNCHIVTVQTLSLFNLIITITPLTAVDAICGRTHFCQMIILTKKRSYHWLSCSALLQRHM